MNFLNVITIHFFTNHILFEKRQKLFVDKHLDLIRIDVTSAHLDSAGNRIVPHEPILTIKAYDSRWWHGKFQYETLSKFGHVEQRASTSTTTKFTV